MRRPFALVMFLASHPAFGATGLVLLPDGTPAADVTVAILGQTGSTRTGRDGRFTWTPDPVPPFDVLLILPGGLYTHPITIQALPDDGTPFVVNIEAALSVTVTVDAGATPFTEAPPASAATILTARSLEESHPDNLTRAIEAIPGVGRLEEGHAAVPSIRGLARGRTLVLVDGARVTTERRAGPSATFLDPSELESVEVARFSPPVQVILRALQRYGMMLADNGSAWFVSGAPDERWNNDSLVGELAQIKGADFEAVDVSPLTLDPSSGQAKPPPSS